MASTRHASLTQETQAALLRLLEVAHRDTGQSRKVAAFLLAWWNAEECGGFDLTDLWGLDTSLRMDVLRIVSFVAAREHYPDTLGFGREFERVIQLWRPHLLVSTPTHPSEAP